MVIEKEKPICPIIFDERFKNHNFIYLSIPGIPIAKQRPRASRRGKFIQIYTPRETKNYEKKVERIYKENYGSKKLNGPLKVEIEGVFAPPINISNKKRELYLNGSITHIKKPDCDNMAKTPLDALNKIAYDDDSQIYSLYVSKKYDNNSELNIKIIERIEKDNVRNE